MKFIFSFALLSAMSMSSANADETLTDTKKMQSVLSRIPVTDKDLTYKNIGERLPNLGMTVERIKVGKIGKGEAEPPDYKVGDEVIDIFLSEPNQVIKAICPISGGRASYVLRGKKTIALTRAAYWLMTNRCDFKG